MRMSDGGPEGYQEESSVHVKLPSSKCEEPTIKNVNYYQAVTFNRLHELFEAQAKAGCSKIYLYEPTYKFGVGMINFLKSKGFSVTHVEVRHGNNNNYTLISW